MNQLLETPLSLHSMYRGPSVKGFQCVIALSITQSTFFHVRGIRKIGRHLSMTKTSRVYVNPHRELYPCMSNEQGERRSCVWTPHRRVRLGLQSIPQPVSPLVGRVSRAIYRLGTYIEKFTKCVNIEHLLI